MKTQRPTWLHSGLAAALLCFAAAAAANAAEHVHDTVPPAGTDVCADLARPPSLRCALTPSAVFAPDGRLWLVWAHSGHVYLNYSEDQGKHFSAAVAVNSVPERVAAHGENRPKIALGPQGQIYVSWTQSLEKRFTGNIRFARSLDGGKSFSAPLIVNDNSTEISHRFEALSVDAEGNVLLAWLDKRDQEQARQQAKPYLGAALYYSWSDDQGKSFKPNRKLLDNSCECCRVVTALDASGQPVLLWRHVFGDNVRDHAVLSFRAPGDPGAAVRVSFDDWKVDACPHHGPALAIDSKDVYHMTWFNNGAQRRGLFYASSKDKGRSVSAPLAFGGHETQAGHAVVLAQDEHVYIVWQDFDGAQSRIWSMLSDDGGRRWAPASVVATAVGEVDYPFLLADSESVYLAWNTRAEGFRFLPFKPVAAVGAIP